MREKEGGKEEGNREGRERTLARGNPTTVYYC